MPEIKLTKKSTKGDLPTTFDAWVEYVNQAHDEGLNARRRYEVQWTLNFSYYKGYQNLLFDPTTGVLQYKRGVNQPLIVNRIGSFIESRHSKITKNRPITKVIPNTNDPEDLRAAKFANDTLTYLWRKIRMENQYDRALIQMLITGNTFMKNTWDPLIGDKISEDKIDTKNDAIEFNESGEVEQEDIFLGEVSSKPLNAFQIIPASENIPEVRDQPWMLERQFLPMTLVKETYPDLKDDIMRASEADKTQYEKIMERLGVPTFSTYGASKDKRRDSLNNEVLVKTLWIKPNKQYEKGLVVVVIGKELAHMNIFPNDYGDNIYPFVHFKEKEDGFSFWSQSSIERLIPIQKSINTLKQKKMKQAVLMSAGKWLLPKGSQVSEESITDEEGEVIEYNPAVPKPEQARLSPLPNYVETLADELISDFRDAGGQRETSVAPGPNITASVAMETQAELSDEILSPLIKRLGRSMTIVANQQMLLMAKEYTDPRTIKIIGEKGIAAVQTIKNTDFRNNTDVHIEIESLFPSLRGRKEQRVIDFWNLGIIRDPQKVLEVLRYGNFDVFFEEVEQLRDTIHEDIQQIKKGKEPPFHPFQNHIAYIKELTKWVNTPEWMRLIPQRKQLSLEILEQHMKAIMPSLPAGGEPEPLPNQAATGSEFGPIKPGGRMKY